MRAENYEAKKHPPSNEFEINFGPNHPGIEGNYALKVKVHGEEPDNETLSQMTGMTKNRVSQVKGFIKQWENVPSPPVSLDAGDYQAHIYFDIAIPALIPDVTDVQQFIGGGRVRPVGDRSIGRVAHGRGTVAGQIQFETVAGATRAAVEEGVVPGGGVALVRSLAAVEKLKGDNEDQNVGIGIATRAMTEPLRQIVTNAGEEGSVVLNKVRDGKGNYGYNAQTGEYTDMIEAGILDPTKVVRTALQNASSIAGLMITTEAMVAELPKEEPAMPGGDMGGMGGMGGMM